MKNLAKQRCPVLNVLRKACNIRLEEDEDVKSETPTSLNRATMYETYQAPHEPAVQRLLENWYIL